MDTRKITKILWEKRNSLRRQNSPGWNWAKYLKGNGIRKVGIVTLTKMANKGELQNKTVLQTDSDLTDPAKNTDELEGLEAADVYFYVMDRDTAEKILVLGLP
jgi:hypothetical protein